MHSGAPVGRLTITCVRSQMALKNGHRGPLRPERGVSGNDEPTLQQPIVRRAALV